MTPAFSAWAMGFGWLLTATLAVGQTAAPTYRAIPGGTMKTLLPPDGNWTTAQLDALTVQRNSEKALAILRVCASRSIVLQSST